MARRPREGWRLASGGCENYFAMALRAAIRPNTTHSPMLPVPWYMLPQMEPNSPAEYRFSIELLLCLRCNACRKHDRRCDYNSLHDRDAVRKPGKLFIAAAP